MRIECPRGCNAMLDVAILKMPEQILELPFSSDDARLAAIRANADRAVGHAITEAVLAHTLLDCPAAAAADADCGATSPMGYTCNLQTGHGGDVHEYHDVHPDEPPEADDHLVASWPALQVVP